MSTYVSICRRLSLAYACSVCSVAGSTRIIVPSELREPLTVSIAHNQSPILCAIRSSQLSKDTPRVDSDSQQSSSLIIIPVQPIAVIIQVKWVCYTLSCLTHLSIIVTVLLFYYDSVAQNALIIIYFFVIELLSYVLCNLWFHRIIPYNILNGSVLFWIRLYTYIYNYNENYLPALT